MCTFGGQVEELENVLIDNFSLYKVHTCFFLSHCHTDHMEGLSQLLLDLNEESNKFVYCSSISRIILLNKYSYANKKVIKELTSAKVITIPGNDVVPSYQVTVTPLPAGHCLGSIMFLFETVKNTILYTGDFRILKNDTEKFKSFNNKNQVKLIDKIYLDTTFLSENYWEFPSRTEVVVELLNLVKNWICQSPNHNVLLITSALYGYEFIFVELAKALKCKIHVKNALHDLFCNIPDVGCFLTKDCESTNIHAFHVFDKKCFSFKNEKLLAIKLSAQWYNSAKDVQQKKIWKQISKCHIVMCYSTHCSCSELVDFLSYLKPKSVEPCCVAVGSTEENTRSYIKELCQSWNFKKQRSNDEIRKDDFSLEKSYNFKLKFPRLESTAIENCEEFPF